MLTNPQGETQSLFRALEVPILSFSLKPFPLMSFGLPRTISYGGLCTVACRAAYISGCLINIILDLTLLTKECNLVILFRGKIPSLAGTLHLECFPEDCSWSLEENVWEELGRCDQYPCLTEVEGWWGENGSS